MSFRITISLIFFSFLFFYYSYIISICDTYTWCYIDEILTCQERGTSCLMFSTLPWPWIRLHNRRKCNWCHHHAKYEQHFKKMPTIFSHMTKWIMTTTIFLGGWVVVFKYVAMWQSDCKRRKSFQREICAIDICNIQRWKLSKYSFESAITSTHIHTKKVSLTGLNFS